MVLYPKTLRLSRAKMKGNGATYASSTVHLSALDFRFPWCIILQTIIICQAPKLKSHIRADKMRSTNVRLNKWDLNKIKHLKQKCLGVTPEASSSGLIPRKEGKPKGHPLNRYYYIRKLCICQVQK